MALNAERDKQASIIPIPNIFFIILLNINGCVGWVFFTPIPGSFKGVLPVQAAAASQDRERKNNLPSHD
jgi:hypothetical protein